MITAVFTESRGVLTGFVISGHAGFAESGKDVVCASVSSAIMLTANIITEGFGLSAKVTNSKNRVNFSVHEENETTGKIISSLVTHLKQISKEFPGKIKISKIKILEV